MLNRVWMQYCLPEIYSLCFLHLDVSVVSPHMDSDGWAFVSVDPFLGATVDPLYNSQHIKDLYFRVEPSFCGPFTVPVLWDRKTHTIVNNESSEIIRMFNSAFDHLLPADKATLDFYPEPYRKEIDEINEWVYETINSMLIVVLTARLLT